MRILLGIDKLMPGHGIPNLVAGMANFLKQRGHDVAVMCGLNRFRIEVPIISCAYSRFIYASSLLDAYRKVRHFDPDIFHSHFYPMDIVGAMVSGKIKYVMHYHGVSYMSLWLTPKRVLSNLRERAGEFVGARRTTKIIAISKFLKMEAIRNFNVEEKKVKVVYNGVDLTRFNPAVHGEDIRDKFRIKEDDRLLLCVGAIAKQKGQHLLIRCLKTITNVAPSIKLILVGGAGMEDYRFAATLKREVYSSGLRRNVFFAGFVPDEALPQYYAACDLYISCSGWEGFGLPFVEAMATGKPIIGFYRTAMSELIIDQFNGFTVQYPDIHSMAHKILEVLRDVDKLREIGKKGRRLAEKKFDLLQNMKEIEVLYKQLM